MQQPILLLSNKLSIAPTMLATQVLHHSSWIMIPPALCQQHSGPAAAVQLLLLFGNSTSQSIFCNRLCDLQANTTKQLLSIMLFDGVACNSATKPHHPPGKIKLCPKVCSDQS
jgi:hypothetical protein